MTQAPSAPLFGLRGQSSKAPAIALVADFHHQNRQRGCGDHSTSDDTQCLETTGANEQTPEQRTRGTSGGHRCLGVTGPLSGMPGSFGE